MGNPILAYSIESVLKRGLFDEVMVTTVDDEIVQVSKQFGANVPFFRSEETANDYAGLNEVSRSCKTLSGTG